MLIRIKDGSSSVHEIAAETYERSVSKISENVECLPVRSAKTREAVVWSLASETFTNVYELFWQRSVMSITIEASCPKDV